MTEAAGCLVCGGPLKRPAVGRPPTYCGVPCRRAGELERERLQRRLERLEDSRAQWQAWGNADDKLAIVDGHIAEAQSRLLALLGAEEGVSPASE
jgi:hypothetical protein